METAAPKIKTFQHAENEMQNAIKKDQTRTSLTSQQYGEVSPVLIKAKRTAVRDSGETPARPKWILNDRSPKASGK